LKNRYGDPTMHRRFTIGIDRGKMKLYNVEDDAQPDLLDTTEDPADAFEDLSGRQKRIDKFNSFII